MWKINLEKKIGKKYIYIFEKKLGKINIETKT
jgi:hypothetical protein